MWVRGGAVLAIVAALEACGGDSCADSSACSSELRARAEAVSAAAEALIELAPTLRAQLSVALCRIAGDLGSAGLPDVGDGSQVTDDDYLDLLDAARARIDERMSNTAVELDIQGPQCTIPVEAQLECEQTCRLDSDCELEGVDARCPPVDGPVTGCAEPLLPPACELDEACQAGCVGRAMFAGDCPVPEVAATGGDDPALIATLEENLPPLLQATARLQLVVSRNRWTEYTGDPMGMVAEALERVQGDLSENSSCATQLEYDVESQVRAWSEAVQTIEVLMAIWSTEMPGEV